jgi:hypothetical protein
MKCLFSRWGFLPLLWFTCLIAIIMPSCDSGRLDADISGIELNLETTRFDRAVFHSQTDDFKTLNIQLSEEYGAFYSDYLYDIIKIGRPDDPMVHFKLEQFVTDYNWQQTQLQIDSVFKDMSEYNTALEKAFKYHRHYFPEDEIPSIIYYHSGFNVGVYPATNYLGIGLEWFLGTDNIIISRLDPERFPQYFKNKLRPDYLVNNAIKGWLLVKHQELVEKEDFMTMLMFHGKIMYLMDAHFPDVSDEVKINYTSAELDWCARNEYNIWAHLLENDMLYTSNAKALAGFFNDGPFTPDFQQASPSRTGVWLGWQIVRQYMEKNPEVTVPQLLREKNPQKILKFYKP